MGGRRTAWLLASSIVLIPISATAAADRSPDVCLEIAAGVLEDGAWASLVTAIDAMAADRSTLFPDPTLWHNADRREGAGAGRRLLIDAGQLGRTDHEPSGACRGNGDWTALIGRAFLDTGADLLLAGAPTTPGIDSHVDIDWIPDESRLVTTLEFAGPLDIPNGTCWLDETLVVEPQVGRAVVTEERGLATSPFAEGACGRFFDYLPDGGAAGQAATLLPVEVQLPDGTSISLITEHVRVREDGVEMGGSIGRR